METSGLISFSVYLLTRMSRLSLNLLALMKIKFIENRTYQGLMQHTKQYYEEPAKTKKPVLAGDQQQDLASKHIAVREPMGAHCINSVNASINQYL